MNDENEKQVFDLKTDEHLTTHQKQRLRDACRDAAATWSVDFDASPLQNIRAGQYFDGQVLWFTVPLACQNKEGVIETRLVLVNSNRELIPADAEHLEPRGFRFNHYPALESRWSKDSIRDFIEGKATLDKKAHFDALADSYSQFVDFGNYRWNLVHAAWILGTYLHQIFEAFPYLSYFGMKGCGKTKSLKLNKFLGFNGRLELAPTESTIYRIAYEHCPTQCFDEFESLGDDGQKVTGQLLRSAYKKGATVTRMERVKISGVGERFQAVDYPVYSPKAMAGTFETPQIAERCIRVTMQRTTDKKIKNSEPREEDSNWKKLRDDSYIFALKHATEIKELYEVFEPPEDFEARPLELWKPLFVITKFVDEIYFNQLLALAREIEAERKESALDTEDYALAKALWLLVNKEPKSYYSIDDIKGYLRQENPTLYDFDEPNKRRSVHSRIGHLLTRHKFLGKQAGGGKLYRIARQDAEEFMDRLELSKTIASEGVNLC